MTKPPCAPSTAMSARNRCACNCPIPWFWPGIQARRSIRPVPRAHDSLRNIFANTLQHFGLQRVQALSLDQFGGCLNVRPRRGGSSYSVHAWGAAVDLDPVNNALRWDRSRAAFARAEYEPFWKIVEEQGWTSLGRQRDYDWMHFQAASL
ncbi:MAG: M15 family metallopeptidase [Rhodanobacteraceae bacterium]|nr:M15 family metallopeptidase [Rhodanobacteraceae bacterium]